MGGKETINSGAMNQDNDFIIKLENPICGGTWKAVSGESKFTTKRQFTLKLETLKRTAKESNHNLPVLHLGFVDFGSNDEFIILRDGDFKALLDYIKDLQNRVVENS